MGKGMKIESVDPSIPAKKSPKKKEFDLAVVADDAAVKPFGSGVIKVTPAHDLADFDIYTRHPEINIIKVIGEDGRMTKEAGARYEGMKTQEAREKIVEDLDKLGLIEKIEDYNHSIARCERCETVIEPLISDQWFVSMEKFADSARRAIEKNKVAFIPESRKKLMLDWSENVRDWNISRQLWWGHRIPAWHCACASDQQWHIGLTPPNEPCKKCKKPWEQTTDVLDTWFSSALWPFVTLGWPDKTDDLKTFYPTAVISAARDIFYLWIFRMLFSGLEFMEDVPFKTIYTHSTILDKHGKKMSKSKGNIIDPMKLIKEYGIDAARFGIIWQAMSTQDVSWSDDAFRAGKKFLKKLWNSGRFTLVRLGTGERKIMAPKNPAFQHNKEILEKLDATSKEIARAIESFEFGQALHTLYDFYWHSFCDIYLEAAKKDSSKETDDTLLYVLAMSLKLLHPFIPFLTEYLWSLLPVSNKKLLVIEEL